MVWSARGQGWGGWRVRKRVGAVWSCRWMVGVLAARAHTQALRKQAVNPITQRVHLFRVTLTCTLNLTPNPKPHLTAGSKPKAEHTPQILPKPLVDSKPYTLLP